MANLSSTSELDLGSGILMPKTRNKWQVLFLHNDPATHDADLVEPLSLARVTNQIVSIKPPKQEFWNDLGLVANQKLSFEYEDDIMNAAASAITEAAESQLKFDMVINVLNGKAETVEQMRFFGCTIIEASHVDALDYRGSMQETKTELRFEPASIIGNLVEEIEGGPEHLALLEEFYRRLSVSLVTVDQSKPGAFIRRKVKVSFESRKDYYAK